MLTLTLSGNNIPLPVDFSMRLTWKSPVCEFEKIPSGYGLGISIPINEYSKMLFGNPERFAKYRVGNAQKFPGFEVRFAGVLLMAGSLIVTNVAGGNYEASLIDNVGVLGEAVQERDILETPEFSESIAWQNTLSYTPETHKYCCFPVQNSKFFTDKGLSVKRTVTIPDPERAGKTKDVDYEMEVLQFCYNRSVQSQVNAKHPVGSIKVLPSAIDLSVLKQKNNTYEAGEVSVVSPFFYLTYVIKKSLNAHGFFISQNSIASDLQLKKLCIYNNFDLTKTVFGISGMIFKDEPVPVYEPDFNLGEFVINYETRSIGYEVYSYIRSYDNTVVPKNHLPKIKLGDMLLSTQNLINVCFDFLPNNQVNIHSREALLTAAAIDIDKFFLGTWEIGEKKNVSLKFTREHDDNDLIFSEGYTDLSDRRGDIKETVANYSALLLLPASSEGDIRFTTENGAFYEYKWITQTKTDQNTKEEISTDVLGWEKISIGMQDGWYEYGRDEIEEIKSSWSSTWGMATNFLPIAVVQQQGNMNAWKAPKQSFSPRLLMHWNETYGGNETPLFSFEYEKPGIGILPKYWKKWNPFWANRLEVSGEFDLPVNMLRHIIYNICSKYRTREGEILIKEMSCELYIDHIGTTTIDGFKV